MAKNNIKSLFDEYKRQNEQTKLDDFFYYLGSKEEVAAYEQELADEKTALENFDFDNGTP